MFKDRNNNYRLKIAFDFDSTLTEQVVFHFAQHLIMCGHDVWIMTARIGADTEYLEQCKRYDISPKEASQRNADLYEVAEKLGIPRNKVIFTNLESKSAAYREYGFDLLFDDDSEWHCDPVCESGGIAVKV
jgi:phosphoserine phosphatase